MGLILLCTFSERISLSNFIPFLLLTKMKRKMGERTKEGDGKKTRTELPTVKPKSNLYITRLKDTDLFTVSSFSYSVYVSPLLLENYFCKPFTSILILYSRFYALSFSFYLFFWLRWGDFIEISAAGPTWTIWVSKVQASSISVLRSRFRFVDWCLLIKWTKLYHKLTWVL